MCETHLVAQRCRQRLAQGTIQRIQLGSLGGESGKRATFGQGLEPVSGAARDGWTGALHGADFFNVEKHANHTRVPHQEGAKDP